ncbi:hypothetical protein EOE18_17470 [Novosphingobium umbonatum]|uniref:Uncharacterized protein n=1 Tax=Novosphingobium umbonatum TaxID=1908524 RepID=A0A3S3TJ50_9SPHN|nr:hypothetical protein [Novosphingobium umbonatum]RVU02255.1 hypothetical protein EOE18_17470 [Novosphingobium umbonatum]
MYPYLDQAIADLPPAARFLTGAMRQWVVSMQQGACASRQMLPLFGGGKMLSGLQPFLRMMGILNRYGLSHLHFGKVTCQFTHEDEAMLLGMLELQSVGAPVQNLAEALVDEDYVPHLMQSIAELSHALQAAGLGFAMQDATTRRVIGHV